MLESETNLLDYDTSKAVSDKCDGPRLMLYNDCQ